MEDKNNNEKIKILLVDDSNIIALFVKSLLNGEIYELRIISDGKKAFDFLLNKDNNINFVPPDVVLLDYNLPGMNGIEILKRLGENDKNYGVIFITSDNRLETAVSAMKEGALDFICKTTDDMNDLPSKINKVFELHNSRLKKRNYEEKLEELNKTKDMFFSIIAHDLKNPFSAIMGYCDFLLISQDHKNIDDFIKFVNIVKNSSLKAYQLLENLLIWARNQTGHIDFKVEKFDVTTVIDDSIAILETQAGNKNIKININVESKEVVFADKNMIATVIRNIISNSIKFTNTGGNINITTKEFEKYIEVSIKDSGVGISNENIKKLFKIDKKYSSMGTANEAGSGLGLILCKDFVEKNGGEIRVESEVGKGTIFRFTIPKAE